MTGTVATGTTSPLCDQGSVATFSEILIVGEFTAVDAGEAASFIGPVNVLDNITATADTCSLEGVRTDGSLSAGARFSGQVSEDGVTTTVDPGIVNGGTYTVVGNAAVASLTVDFCVTVSVLGTEVLKACVEGLSLTAEVTATPVPPDFGTAAVAGTVTTP